MSMKRSKRILTRMNEKLKNKSGESISEVLVALLISALAIVLLASMIAASTNMVMKSKAKFKEYADAENAIVERNGSDVSGTVQIVDSNDNPISLTDGAGTGIQVAYFTNDESVRHTVRSYKVK